MDKKNSLLIGDGKNDYNAAIKNQITFLLRLHSQNQDINKKNVISIRDFNEL